MRRRMVRVVGMTSVVMLGCLHAPVLWSPDGRWLAYTMAVRPGAPSLTPGWIFEAGREAERPLSWGDQAPRPAAAIYRLWATRADTGASVVLEESRGPLTSPCWSPDGKALAFGRLVPEDDGRARFEVVVQEALDRKTVLFQRPCRELGDKSADLPSLAPAWSPSGSYLAVPVFEHALGLALIRADNGRLLKEEKDAYFPSWSPDGTKLAFLGGGDDAESLYVLDDNFGPARHLAEIGRASQPPIWSRDGRSVAIVTRALSQRNLAHPTQQSDLVRIQVETGKVETLTLNSDPGDRAKTYNGASFSFDRDGEELFYTIDVEGQPSVITWFQPRTRVTHKKFNPLDYTIRVGSLALAPKGGTLAFRAGPQGHLSPPAVYDLAANTVTPIVPDDAARVEWITTLIGAARPLLRGCLPPAIVEGRVVEHPTLLPIPREFDPNQETTLRLRRLGRIGRSLCDRPADAPPATPALEALLDEARLFFDVLREDYRSALASLEAFETRTTDPEQRLRLLSVRAQIFLGQGQLERALETIAFLQSISRGEPRRVEMTPVGMRMTSDDDPTGMKATSAPVSGQGWPSYLALRARSPRRNWPTTPSERRPRSVTATPTPSRSSRPGPRSPSPLAWSGSPPQSSPRRTCGSWSPPGCSTDGPSPRTCLGSAARHLPPSAGEPPPAVPSHTTPSSTPCPGFVTITHPGHPLCGQRVEVIRSGPGVDPDFLVRRADGRYLPIARSSTDADPQPSDDPAPLPNHLLDLEGLRRILPVLDRMARAASAAPEQGVDPQDDRPGGR